MLVVEEHPNIIIVSTVIMKWLRVIALLVIASPRIPVAAAFVQRPSRHWHPYDYSSDVSAAGSSLAFSPCAPFQMFNPWKNGEDDQGLLLVHKESGPSKAVTTIVNRSDHKRSTTIRHRQRINEQSRYISLAAAFLFAMTTQFLVYVPPVSARDDNLARGSTLFQANCSGCHGGGMNFIKEKKTLQKQALEKYLGGTDAIKIQDFVQK